MAIKRMAAAVLAALMCLCGLSAPASAEELPVFGSMKDLMAYLYCDCACMLQEEIAFYYTGELDDVFASPDALRYMMRNCGLIQWDQARNTEKRRVRMDNIVYAPGFRIAQAWRMGMTDDLTDEEREVLAIAQGIVREAEENASSPFGVLVNLHDALLERVSYAGTTADGVSAEDTAVGALKYGGAECDGYTDAFYLLAALAGHQAGYLRGSSAGGAEGGHIWNVVLWNGKWYHADLLWDDMDIAGYPEMTTYHNFMLGASMNDTHVWEPAYSPFDLAEHTDWECFYYTADNTGLTCGAYYEELQHAADYALHHINNGYSQAHVMVKGNYDGADEINRLISAAAPKTRWATWTYRCGEYTVFDILIG